MKKEKKAKTDHWPAKILHMDMDAFFAAVEQKDNPELRGLPVIVGGDPYGRGVVSTCSYEARKFGIRSAMPAAEARKRCPEAVFIRPRIERYREISKKVMAIFRQHTELVEAVSLDEAYLDITHNRLNVDDPVMVASLIKQSIHAVTGLTVSAGVSINMLLAKLASDMDKPDGLKVIGPEDIESIMESLAIRKIPGVGPVTEKALLKYGIKTCSDLTSRGLDFAIRNFGKNGESLFRKAIGQDSRQVEPGGERKQCSTEETFDRDITSKEFLLSKLKEYSDEIFYDLQKKQRAGKTITLKVKYHDFKIETRSKTLHTPPASGAVIYKVASEMLERRTLAFKKPIRLLGLGIQGLQEAGSQDPLQRDLFGENAI